jgi:hypothetical protein
MSGKRMPAKEIAFRFMASRESGTPDHFFHFLFGYLLPALDIARDSKAQSVAFSDCGPLMKKPLEAACEMMALNLVPEKDAHGFFPVPVPRWDKWLKRPDGSLPPQALISAFERTTGQIRRQVLALAASQAGGMRDDEVRDEILIIARSPDHPYYAPGGAAKFAHYGAGRRAVENLEEIADSVRSAGWRARIADVGALSLAEQIMAFHRARAVIGVRGAEFAHLFWMEPGQSALIFSTPVSAPSHAARTLAKIRDIPLNEMEVLSDHFAAPIDKVGTWLKGLARDAA